jgi:hypothetical protein
MSGWQAPHPLPNPPPGGGRGYHPSSCDVARLPGATQSPLPLEGRVREGVAT